MPYQVYQLFEKLVQPGPILNFFLVPCDLFNSRLNIATGFAAAPPLGWGTLAYWTLSLNKTENFNKECD